MGEAVLAVAINQLNKFTKSRVSLIIGVKSSAESLQHELVYMEALLKDVQLDEHDNRVQQWLHDMTDIATDTVTVLGDFTDSLKGTGCLGRARFLCSCWAANNLANQIKSIRRRVEQLRERKETYDIRINNASNVLRSPHELHSKQNRSCTKVIFASQCADRAQLLISLRLCCQ